MQIYWYFALSIAPYVICHPSSIIHSDSSLGAATVLTLSHSFESLQPCSRAISIHDKCAVCDSAEGSALRSQCKDSPVSGSHDRSFISLGFTFNFYCRWAVKEWMDFTHQSHPNPSLSPQLWFSQVPYISCVHPNAMSYALSVMHCHVKVCKGILCRQVETDSWTVVRAPPPPTPFSLLSQLQALQLIFCLVMQLQSGEAVRSVCDSFCTGELQIWRGFQSQAEQ